MSTIKIFAIHDDKVSSYQNFHFEANEIMAVRGLQIALKNPQIQLSMFPEDFSLYFMGEVDDITGVITPCLPPKFIVSATTIKSTIPKEG